MRLQAASLMMVFAWTLSCHSSCIDAAGTACIGNKLLCPIGAHMINCSAGGDGQAPNETSSAIFDRDQPDVHPSLITLSLPAAVQTFGSFSVASLQALMTCFQLSYSVTLQLVSGSAVCRLMPGSLDALGGIQRLSLKLRLHKEKLPAGLFTSRLASLQNLELVSPGVSSVEAGAFAELRQLKRLSVVSLKLTILTSATLRGLAQLQVLELLDNELTTLDAASFGETPRLETVDLRTGSALLTSVARDTFCRLTRLWQLFLPRNLQANCSSFDFASARVHLVSKGVENVCVRNTAAARSPCDGAAHPDAGTTLTSTATTAAATKPDTSSIASTSSTQLTSTTSASTTGLTTSTTSTTSAASTSSGTSTTSSAANPARRPDKQGTAGGRSAASGSTVAIALVAVALVLLVTGVAAFYVARRRQFRGVGVGGLSLLRRAQSRQPIYSAGGSSLDMQDAQWNPVYQGSSGAEPADPAGDAEATAGTAGAALSKSSSNDA